jgi:hypothetical protein
MAIFRLFCQRETLPHTRPFQALEAAFGFARHPNGLEVPVWFVVVQNSIGYGSIPMKIPFLVG